MQENTITQTIINTINTLFSSLFSSIDNNMYSVLDDIVFINTDILQDKFMSSFFGDGTSSGLILLANSLLIGFSIFYIVRYSISHYTSSEVEQPFQFIFKLFFYAVLANSSYFLIEQLVNINSLISLSIREIGENIFNCNISFSELIIKLNNIVTTSNNSLNVFSLDGLLKGFVSLNLLNLLFTYSLRYVILKVFILITPFAVITLINSSTSWFFRSWFRTVISLLLLQSLVSLILLVVFSTNFTSSDVLSKLICIGSIYALTKANTYIRDLIGGISTEFSANVSSLRYLIK